MYYHPLNYKANPRKEPATVGQIKTIQSLLPELMSEKYGSIDLNTLSQFDASNIIGYEKRQGRSCLKLSSSPEKPATVAQWGKLYKLFTTKRLTTTAQRYEVFDRVGAKFDTLTCKQASSIITYLESRGAAT